jgi:hypothetical protein
MTDWVVICGFTRYLINRDGIVKRACNGQITQPSLHKNGRKYMYIYDDDGKLKARSLAELVAMSFIGGPPEPHYFLKFLDNDFTNTCIDNLRWMPNLAYLVPENGMEWRSNSDFPDYLIREDGAIQRIGETRNKSWGKGRLIRSCIGENGYCNVSLFNKDGEYQSTSVHNVVARTFIGAPSSIDHEVCHNDGNPSNNHYTNLR